MTVLQRDGEDLNKAKSAGWGARNGLMTHGQKEAAACEEGHRSQEITVGFPASGKLVHSSESPRMRVANSTHARPCFGVPEFRKF